MKQFVLSLVLLLSPLQARLQAREPGGRAHYVGGTNADLPLKADGLIRTSDPAEMSFAGK